MLTEEYVGVYQHGGRCNSIGRTVDAMLNSIKPWLSLRGNTYPLLAEWRTSEANTARKRTL